MNEKPHAPLAPLKFYTIKELAGLYVMDRRVLTRRLAVYADEIGEKDGWYFNIRQVEVIFNLLGHPRTKARAQRNDKESTTEKNQ